MTKVRKLEVLMPDNSTWRVRVEDVITMLRALEKEAELIDSVGALVELGDSPSDDHLIMLAEQNLDWEDVEPWAERYDPPKPDYDDGWATGDKQIVEEDE